MNHQTAVLPPWYYRLAIWVARPIYRLSLFFKKDKLPFYEQEIAERFGTNYTRPKPNNGKVIWCHAVSLGELNTAYPVLKSLLDDGHALYITSTTQTGFRRATELFETELAIGQVVHSFVPVDELAVIYRFLMCVRPDLAMFVETELWANTLFLLNRMSIPSVLLNARLKDKSLKNYQKFSKLSKSMLANLSLVIAQDKRSFDNFLALGLDKDKLRLANSLKWSQKLATPTLQNLPNNRPIWTAGSTHRGEDEIILVSHQVILQTFPNALLILVPRHPERFDEVFALCQKIGLTTARRSKGETVQGDTQVYLADTMGELLSWYQTAEVAFVGGSLLDGIGGHNPIEPASVATPVLIGKFTKSCDELVAELASVGACQVIDNTSLAGAVMALFDGETAQIAGQAGYELFRERQGAYLEQKGYLLELLKP